MAIIKNTAKIRIKNRPSLDGLLDSLKYANDKKSHISIEFVSERNNHYPIVVKGVKHLPTGRSYVNVIGDIYPLTTRRLYNSSPHTAPEIGVELLNLR